MIKVKCSVCGKEFEALRSTKKYCDKNCEYEARRMREKENNTSLKRTCLICEKEFILKSYLANKRQCCYECMPEGKQLTRTDFIAKLKEKSGGKCQRCGYNKSLVALDFHHIDSSKKDFTISDDNFRLIDAVKEIKKCILICSNCHREYHAGL